ncbi:hypothetical protein HH1059_17980 [Halorhodospira halochloris]|uniref:ABC3 transporter permease C-terminal domain-containing protein n=1 Tax=Halorhodospira halochloris TaxID=1052 RepID=A0A0X8XAJ6_HALHR|nr:FtsX-like permease family protein [Halorhodospira halochloris]MBK1651624.1 hypothetical protein [Halorhodospira halochloris]BAU58486.1 hypothetical protein HH1059_17980 [Halorhodospira halochloris]
MAGNRQRGTTAKASVQLAMRLLVVDLRAGHLGILVAALVVAVAAVSSVGWVTERAGAAAEERAAELVAADRVVRANQPVPAEWREQATELGLAAARMVEFPTVVMLGERSQLVAVKAVEQGYPLRGQLLTSAQRDGEEQDTTGPPPDGEAWVEPRLLALLDTATGEELELGDKSLTISRLITAEPDRAQIFGALGPRVLISWSDMESSGLVVEGSQVRHALLLAGDQQALDAFAAWLKDDASGPAQEAEVLTGSEAQPAVETITAQAERFLGLAALITVVVAAAAVLLTARHYAAAQLDRIAMMRVLGARQGTILLCQGTIISLLALLAGLFGVALGYALQALMLALLSEALPPNLGAPGPMPALYGIGVGMVAAAGFALPSVIRLRHVPPMRVLRRSAGSGVVRSMTAYLIAGAVLIGLLLLQAGDLQLGLTITGVLLLTLMALGLAAGLVILLAAWLRRRSAGRLWWLSGPTRRPAATLAQVVAVGVGLMALLTLSVVHDDLLDTWQDSIPADAADTFMIDLAPHEVEPLRDYLAAELGRDINLFAMVRGRLEAISGEQISVEDYDSPRTRRMVSRDANLTWADELPADNEVIAGSWWGDEPGAEWSVEESYAEQLGIEVGDELSFVIDGETVRGTVTSLREVSWISFNPNFFVIAAPGLLDADHPEYITSFRLGEESDRLLAELSQRFPGATPIDVGAIIATGREIVDQGVRVVEIIASLTLLAGLIVLLAALRTAAAERRFEASLMRALGASRRRLGRAAVAELAFTGALAGALAGVGAAAGGYFAARELFELDYSFPWLVVLLGLLAGAILVATAGWLGARRDWRSSPMELLRAGEAHGSL